jgi:diaminopimelate epimerase
MRFTKAHGTANDFVVLVDLDDDLDLPVPLVRALCDRRRGVGADGVLRLGAPTTPDADVFMDYRNADGSIVEMCGNGVRVVAKHVVDHGLVAPRDGRVVVGTRAGDKPVTVHLGDDGRVATVTVDMGPPSFDPAVVGYEPDGDPGELDLGDVRLDVTAVSMGNPHVVTLVDDVATAPVTTVGPRVETDRRFPSGTNVEFAEVVSDREVRLRVWERGVGETASCGTGVCATYAALHAAGRLADTGEVHVPGGTLTIRYRPDEHPSVIMTGPAVEVATGTLDEAWLAAARAGDLPTEVLR